MKQIHTDVDPRAWDRLFARTSEWPAGKRNQADICRYAIRELHHDMTMYPADTVASPMTPGKKHVQVRTNDPEEAALWASVAERFPPNSQYTTMLRVALAQLSVRMA